MKKSRPTRKLSQAWHDANYALQSAVVRGESEKVIHDLRVIRDMLSNRKFDEQD